MFQFVNTLAASHTIAEVNLTAFRYNIIMVKKQLKNCMMMAVVKTNAYGHGIVPIAQEAIQAGADRIGVTSVEEGSLLRQCGIHVPIHILPPITSSQAKDVVYHHLTATISSVDIAESISKMAVRQQKRMPVHLKLNTGLQRFGIEPNDALSFCKACYHLPGLSWEGIFTHFSSADEGDWSTTENQFHLFTQTTKKLHEAGYSFPVHHVGASTIAIEREDMHLDMVRTGIALYGYTPDRRQDKLISLNRVLSLKSKLIHIRSLPPGSSVGYGGEYVTKANEKIGVLPIGHGDGFKRLLSNNGLVLVKGQCVPIIGTISLDQTFVNLTAIPNVHEGDEVVIIGSQHEQIISARDIADWIHSNIDEVLASLMSRIKRVYVNDG
ncbi:alanine racemase [Virgibacillus sp. M23]|uniref:alanine racemase n=1 Tax=Virgibacillus sp. M23 TaxID=3079030 RepID=UPI002A91447E|nr:alanine racemase [Virgibacillus sp. M23]MDY7043587.1 alanine racemase [Virgibacillus sp. M23]